MIWAKLTGRSAQLLDLTTVQASRAIVARHDKGTRLARLLSLFRLEFRDPRVMPESIAGRPVYLALCMNEAGVLRFKPQNLLVNLPLADRS